MDAAERRREALRAHYSGIGRDNPGLPGPEPREIALGDEIAAVFVEWPEREHSARVAHLWTFAGDVPRSKEVFADPEHPNVAAFRRFHEAQSAFYAGGPAEPVAALLAADAEWHVPGRNAIAGDYRGRDEVLDYFSRRRDLAERTFSIEVRDVLGADAGVVTLAYGRAEIGGEAGRWGTAGVYRIGGEKITGGWLLPMDQRAFDGIWI